MKNLGVWLVMTVAGAAFWVFSIFIVHLAPGRVLISINDQDMTNWPGKDGFYLFPALMTLTYAAISVLLVLHGKKKIKLAYDEIDPKLSRSLLILSFFSVTGILLLGEISLVLMNR